MTHYETIIIGAGHNGLVAAAYLAKRGQKILVLERRPIVGGSLAHETFGEGFDVDAVWPGGVLRPDICRDLNLARFGLDPQPVAVKPALIAPQSDSAPLTLESEATRTAESLRRFSTKDAARWPEFIAFMNQAAHFLDATYATLMPRLPKNFSLEEGYGLLELGLDLRLLGRKDMLKVIRLLPMTVTEFLEEWFESESLKAALASVAIHSITAGPYSAGTGYTLLHHWLNRGGLAHTHVGKAGEISQALVRAVQAYGGEIRTKAEVQSILVEGYTCRGVKLTSGEEILAQNVISTLDPKRTFLQLVGAPQLPPEFVWKVRTIKMRGSVAKVHLLTDGNHGIPAGTVVIAPSIPYLEKAYDAAKYGEISQKPYLEVTTSGHTVSIHFQFAPYALKGGDWNSSRETLEKLAIDTLAEYFPNLKSSIRTQTSLTPLDLEQRYGLTEGDLNHGQLLLDQFLFMRPIPGWS
ncbi:MAG: phytoene desaturase family protein [Anaerolineae bacterium]